MTAPIRKVRDGCGFCALIWALLASTLLWIVGVWMLLGA